MKEEHLSVYPWFLTHLMRRVHLEKGQGGVLLFWGSQPSLSAHEWWWRAPLHCRAYFMQTGMAEHGCPWEVNLPGLGSNLPASHRVSSMALVWMDLGKSYLKYFRFFSLDSMLRFQVLFVFPSQGKLICSEFLEVILSMSRGPAPNFSGQEFGNRLHCIII